MENKYKEGQVVHAKVNPALKLVIRRYVDRIYYCKVQNDPTRKELVYFEREIEADQAPTI
jgi:ribosomal protein L21E